MHICKYFQELLGEMESFLWLWLYRAVSPVSMVQKSLVQTQSHYTPVLIQTG